MKKTVLGALALCLTGVLATGSAFAQDSTDSTKSSRSRSSSGTSGSSSGAYGSSSSTSSGLGSTSSSGLGSSSSQMGKPVRLSKLMHQGLRGQFGDSLG